ncbi:EF-hand domain-containing protein [Pseudomonas sp. PDM03]|uniref:XopAW family type III secretion system calcium-binding effector n=1 Tax=Pseudomonas TaxID=286 RepID=UPI0017814FFF|nr:MULTISPECIES: XopAW family type III secretion system calcium-binding effector [Pseudomonas]MBD9590659.1 EF-hand domain-containing protein [Pseudomonas sp. PDM03]MCP1519901.1 Ca2+-binding EF-hand superfamily protein [Pseudomonas migulae]
MIGSVSNYTSYTSTSSTTTSNARSQQFQKELLARLDTNSDGSVDQDELTSALSQKTEDGLLVSLSKNFADLDSDDSGSLSSEEMAAMAPPPPPPRDQAPNTELADALISALDSDSDGAISSDELSNGLTNAGSSADSTEIFSALDKNEDGVVSKDELAASLAPPPPPPQQVPSDELFSQLDADSDGSVSASELSSALQAGREKNSNSATGQANVTEALNKMIANLSKQYSLDKVATVGKYLNVTS